MSEEQIKVAVDWIIERNGKILFGKRLNAIGEGTYGVPGGHLEFGESIVDAAKRELKEETGLVSKEMKLVCVIDQPRTVTPQHYIHFLFYTSKFDGEPQLTEPDRCAGWEWFDIKNPPANIFVSHKSFLTAFLEKSYYIYD